MIVFLFLRPAGAQEPAQPDRTSPDPNLRLTSAYPVLMQKEGEAPTFDRSRILYRCATDGGMGRDRGCLVTFDTNRELHGREVPLDPGMRAPSFPGYVFDGTVDFQGLGRYSLWLSGRGPTERRDDDPLETFSYLGLYPVHEFEMRLSSSVSARYGQSPCCGNLIRQKGDGPGRWAKHFLLKHDEDVLEAKTYVSWQGARIAYVVWPSATAVIDVGTGRLLTRNRSVIAIDRKQAVASMQAAAGSLIPKGAFIRSAEGGAGIELSPAASEFPPGVSIQSIDRWNTDQILDADDDLSERWLRRTRQELLKHFKTNN